MASLHNHFLGVGSISRLFPGFIQGGADLKDTALRILQSKILAILGDSGVLLPPDIGVYDPHLIGVGWSFYRPLQGPQEGKGRGGGSAWAGGWKDRHTVLVARKLEPEDPIYPLRDNRRWSELHKYEGIYIRTEGKCKGLLFLSVLVRQSHLDTTRKYLHHADLGASLWAFSEVLIDEGDPSHDGQ